MSPHSEVFLDGSDSGESPPSLIDVNGTNPNGSDLANGIVNGRITHKPHSNKSSFLPAAPLDETYDLICIGFGPASLSVAVALHDALASSTLPTATPPKVLFIEKQHRFAWHAGMLLPGAKMQISFVKDLATLRDPRSEFTFLNYLHRAGRLVDFTNLGTFLPARREYEDYLRWCSSYFDHLVQYNQKVVSVSPEASTKGAVRSFTVCAQDVQSGQRQSYRGKNVLLATGGQPALPKSFPQKHPRVIHSSQYAHMVPKVLPKTGAPYRVAVVGAGQSAAEIFSNIQTLYPNSETWLVMRQEFLRPSDDSPFVNSVFNPEYIDTLFPKSASYRNNLLSEARSTNYGVVRLELIEELYERMYEQRRELGTDEKTWPHRILGGRQIVSVDANPDDNTLSLKTQHIRDGSNDGFVDQETLQADLVIAATGYQRDAHVDILRDTWDMLPKAAPGAEFSKGITGWNVETEAGERKMMVGRDYRVKFAKGAVDQEAGVWLQGCCEGTHGLSDTLLSVLATRSGEIVESIFGNKTHE